MALSVRRDLQVPTLPESGYHLILVNLTLKYKVLCVCVCCVCKYNMTRVFSAQTGSKGYFYKKNSPLYFKGS